MSKKILIVDDDPRNIFALKLTLKARGYSVETCTTAQEAFEFLKSDDHFSVVLMDMMMPGIDGYEAVKIIRSTPGINDTPVIAVTAQAMPEDRQKCIDVGASEYISKPINVDLLITAIERLS